MTARFLLVVAGLALAALGARGAEPRPLAAAHAHNDYEHARPLLDALDHGFASVEVDVWLVDGRLLVAHSLKDVQPERTLEALYLDPLRARVRQNGGRVFRRGPTLTLLIDVKSEAVATLAALEPVLARYADLLTSFRGDKLEPRAVTVILSGNRAHTEVAARPVRLLALDGRSGDLDSTAPAALLPWISENWTKLSAWRGEGALPDADAAKLRDWVQRAHAVGRRIRFWNTPDTPAVWRVLRTAGVDLIGTDNLAALRDFLAAESPAASARDARPVSAGKP